MTRTTPPIDASDCELARVALRNADATELELARYRAHVRGCRACTADSRLGEVLAEAADDRAWAEDVLESSRRPLGPAVGLAIAAAAQTVLGAAWLLGRNPTAPLLGRPSGEHLARDGALGLLLAGMAVTCLARPRWASALSPLCLLIVAVHLVGGLLDRHEGRVAWHFEAVHGIGLLIVGIIVLMGYRYRRNGPYSN